MDSEAADGGVLVVLDEEVITVGAFNFFNHEIERIVGVKVVDGFVHVFFGAVGFFDFESV